MNIHARPVVLYRWVVFLLAAGYAVYQIMTADYSSPGGPFRFLTIWALMLSFYSASRMLALSEVRIRYDHQITAMSAAVLNAMVVFLYWKLYFADPALVNGNGQIVWHQEFYLHAVGPALQIFDALFIARVFVRPWRAVLPLLGIIMAYVAWAELFVQRFNATPVGTVTSGLPYPFLNSLEISGRATFYVSNGAVSVVLLLVFAGLMWAIDRFRQALPATATAAQPDSSGNAG
jgi:hypothetical protein